MDINKGNFDPVQELLEENARLRQCIAQLQEEINRLKNRNSRNSSKPPSQDFKKNSQDSGNKGGAQKEHPANQRVLIPEDKVDETVSLTCQCCPTCKGASLAKSNRESFFQYADLIDGRIHVTNFSRCGYRCTHCQKRFLAPLPSGVGSSPYGPGIRAAICTFTARYHLSKREAASFFSDFFAFHISSGIISKIEAQAAKNLQRPYQTIQERILDEKTTVYVDETGWRHAGRNAYIWEMSTKEYTLYQIHSKRNKEARDALLGSHFRKPIVTDRYSVYRSLTVPHQYCLAHLLRDFKSFAESKGAARFIGKGLHKDLEAIFDLWKLYTCGKMTFLELKKKCRWRRKSIKDWLKDGIFSLDKRLSRFSWNLLGDIDCLWTFLRIQGMEPTNNQAERDLRPMVLWRKKSFGTKGEGGRSYVTVIGSIVQTLRKQKRSVYQVLKSALADPLQQSMIFAL